MTPKAIKTVGVVRVDIPVTQEHVHLRELAKKLQQLQPNDQDICDLADGLTAISFGEDANEALSIKRKPGQSNIKQARTLNLNLAITWISAAISPGCTKLMAIEQAAKLFDLDEDHLSRQFRKHKHRFKASGFSMNEARPSTIAKK